MDPEGFRVDAFGVSGRHVTGSDDVAYSEVMQARTVAVVGAPLPRRGRTAARRPRLPAIPPLAIPPLAIRSLPPTPRAGSVHEGGGGKVQERGVARRGGARATRVLVVVFWTMAPGELDLLAIGLRSFGNVVAILHIELVVSSLFLAPKYRVLSITRPWIRVE